MDTQEVQKLITDGIEANKTVAQFGVSKVPFHTHNNLDSPPVSYLNLAQRTRYVLYRIVAPTTAVSVANVVGGDLVIPFGGFFYTQTISYIGATVDTAGTTGTMSIDVNVNGSSIMSTKITLDSAEKTSRTAATLPVVNITKRTFALGDIFTFDVDTVQTTPANGLTIFIKVVETTT